MWKSGIKYKKKNCNLFIIMHLFMLHFFLPNTSPAKSILLVVARINNIRVFVVIFFPLWSCCYDNWNIVFSPIAITTTGKETNSFNKTIALINRNYPWENEVKKLNLNQEKLSQNCIFFPIAKDPDPSHSFKKWI